MELGRTNFEHLIAKLETAAIARFLTRMGFQKCGEEQGRAEVYRGRQGELLIVPTNKSLRDYTRRLCELVEIFAIHGLTTDDVLAQIVLPECDVLRYRIQTPDTLWGHLRLGYGYEAMHALFDVLKYSAAGVSTHKTDYRNISEEAQAYASKCRFGQTELGSFVMKIYCPTAPVACVDTDTEPFGRVSTKSTVENFAFIASEQSQDPSQPLPPTLNRQVATAVNRLKPDSEFGTSVLAVHYSPLLSSQPCSGKVPLNEPLQVTLDLGPLVYGRAQSIRDRLKKAEEFGREVLVGYITDLHKDRPMVTEQSRQITLEVKYGSTFRKVTLRLLPVQYRQAVKWHDMEEKLRLDAVFDKRGRPWAVSELFDLSPLDPYVSDATLFDTFPERPPDATR